MSSSWHEENCKCEKCTIYKTHDEMCGCAPCYYRERYNHYKNQNLDYTELQTNYDKLKIERENLLKGKWEILGSGDFNKNNKTVYEHDILMDQQEQYFLGRLKTLESAHVSQKIELNSKLTTLSEQLEKQESVLKIKLTNQLNAEIKTNFGLTLTELFATVGELNNTLIGLEAQSEKQLMSALTKIGDEANLKIRKQKGFVIEQQLKLDEQSLKNDNLIKKMQIIKVELDCLRKDHVELKKRVETATNHKVSLHKIHERSVADAESQNEFPENKHIEIETQKINSDFTHSPEKYEMDCADTIDEDSDEEEPDANTEGLPEPDFDKIQAPMKTEKHFGTVDLTIDTMDLTIDSEML